MSDDERIFVVPLGHPHPEDLASGRVVIAGSEVREDELNLGQQVEGEEKPRPNDPGDQRLLSEVLIQKPVEEGSGPPPPTDAAQRKASDLGVDIAEVEGSGGEDDNQVTVGDVIAHAEKENDNG